MIPGGDRRISEPSAVSPAQFLPFLQPQTIQILQSSKQETPAWWMKWWPDSLWVVYMWCEPWHNCWSLNKANSKQQTVSCFWVWGVWKSFWGRGTTWFSSSGYNSTVTKSARKHGEWIACLHKPYPISHIHHVSASVRTNLLRSESHFQPFKAVPSSRKRSVASKAGQNVTTWKKDETCCQEWGTEYCQRLPTGLADNGVAISLISGYAKGNFYL